LPLSLSPSSDFSLFRIYLAKKEVIDRGIR
jgi:hypothetical protein